MHWKVNWKLARHAPVFQKPESDEAGQLFGKARHRTWTIVEKVTFYHGALSSVSLKNAYLFFTAQAVSVDARSAAFS
jgi:hypothetical protein